MGWATRFPANPSANKVVRDRGDEGGAGALKKLLFSDRLVNLGRNTLMFSQFLATPFTSSYLDALLEKYESHLLLGLAQLEWP
jgi:hypothetical protein